MNTQSSHLIQYLPKTNQEIITDAAVNLLGYMDVHALVSLFNDSIYSCIEAIGITPAYLLSRECGIRSVQDYGQYYAAIYARQTISIHSRFLGYSRKRLHLMHFMLLEPHLHIVATYENIIVHTNRHTQRTMMWSENIRKNIMEIVKAHQQLLWDAPTCGILHPF